MARTSRRARKASPLYLPSAFELFTPSKELVLKNIWIFGPLYATFFIFYIHSWIWTPKPGQNVEFWQNAHGFSTAWPGAPLPTYLTFMVVGLSILWFMIIGFIGTAVQIMSQRAQLDASQGKPLHFRDLFAAVREIGWRMLGLYLLSSLAIIFSLFILARRYLLAPYVMLENKTGILESMKLSSELSGRNPGAVWGVIGVMVLIGLVNIVPVIGGLSAFILGGLYSLAPAIRFQQLKKLT